MHNVAGTWESEFWLWLTDVDMISIGGSRTTLKQFVYGVIARTLKEYVNDSLVTMLEWSVQKMLSA